ncbi:HSP20-like chaperone [Macroventuria anomochaeta]|uniref:HSP20-like chaperone n=1 Tax=Macroventuria anomochaeta TaxID=301207 RepID=A0ACB6RUX8_9PLEO|nr:HSP20-like chaperone [Macroventuria anomochaeta]KAF2625517.1 HSP20-like chaperone [Macroventuria anomochaeta]
MAYILTPRFAQAYQASQCNPFGFCAPTSQPTHGYRTVERLQPESRPSPFASFFSQLDDLVSEIDRESQRQAQIEAQRKAQRAAQIEAQREAYQAHVEAQRAAYRQRQAQIEAHIAAQREAHRQRQLRKRALRAQFAVTQNEQGWQIDAEAPGFEQDNISIEVTDENTLKIAGNTKWGAKPQVEAQPEDEATPAIEQPAEVTIEQTTEESADEKMESITLEPSAEIAAEATETGSFRPATPDSDTSSHKSYQATVEDDFEDLGPEASTLFSTPSTPATPSEPKGKEKAVESVEHHENVEDPEVSVPETAVTQQPQPEVPAQQQQEAEERPHGSFERTFRFPERIDASNVRASMKEGVLSITVPRAQAQQVRRIAIL